MEKNLIVHSSRQRKKLNVILLKMKLLTALLFAGTMVLSASTYSQKTKIDLRLQNSSMTEILNSIEKNSEFIFIYNANVLNTDAKKSISVKGENIEKILDILFFGAEVSYRIDDRQIFLYKKEDIIKQESMHGKNEVEQPQKKNLKGEVTDAKGEPIPGTTVLVKGTTVGTITDSDGMFKLDVPIESKTLVISFVGFTPQEIPIGNKIEFHVILNEMTVGVDEVIVTAFATQKKINVTGSISAINGQDLVVAPVANITNALIGNSPGISGMQTSGEPGRNSTNIYIRGMSTYGNTTPLVVIDGIEQAAERAFDELNSIDANEIAGVSIMKDASSTAVYGIRGANGVIIVTTKRGNTGRPVINFSSNFGFTKATGLQEGVSAYEWAQMRNEGIRNEMNSYPSMAGLAAYLYSDGDLWKFKNNRDFTPEEVAALPNLTAAQQAQLNASPAMYYGSRDLYAEQFGETGPQKQLNLNISGGNGRIKYFTSLGYFNQKSITNSIDYYGSNTGSKFDRYNFRSNFDIEVMKNLKVSLNLAGQFGTTQGPGIGSGPYDLSGRYKIIMQYIYDGNPFMTPGIIDGHLVNGYAGVAGTVQNPLALKTASQIGNQNAVYNLLNSGTGYLYNTLLDNSIKVAHTMDYLIKGLTIHGTVNYQDNYNRYVSFSPSIPSYTVQRNLTDPNKLDFFGGAIYNNTFSSYGYSNWNKLYLDAGADYAGKFGDHSVSALLLGKASRYTMPGDANNTPSGVMGLVGRITYNFSDRYMAEFNMGYNGTEQFAEGKRFGFFPAYSLGWVSSKESFFPKNDWITFLKLRASYGEVGNDLLGGTGRRYLYFPNAYSINQSGYWLGNRDGSSVNDYYTGVMEGTLGNPDITWEKSKKIDIGFESKFIKDKLAVAFDYFKEDRNNILTTLGTIPSIYGVPSGSVPPVNIGITTNKGYELTIGWSDKIGKLGYNVEGDVSYAHNKIIYRAEAPNPYYWMNQTGYSIGQRFGLVSEGLFNTVEDLANRPYNTYTSNKATLGDIRYKDLNGDGLINNMDVCPIGYTNYPEYHFNLKFKLNYKGFDIRALFIGTANGSYYLSPGYTLPFYKKAGNVWKWMYDGRWTPEKVATGESITYPRSTFDHTTTDNNFLTSDFWMVSSNFFKLKNVEIGYTFPSKGIIRAANLNAVRIYANGNNLYTFKNKLQDKGIDPETTDGSTYIYPLTSVFSVGLSMQF